MACRCNERSRRDFLIVLASMTACAAVGFPDAIFAAEASQNPVFFSSATGNSLYVASKISPTLLSIPQEMRKASREYKGDTIGIAAPVYCLELPKIVCRFVENSKFDTDYFYFVLTYDNDDTVSPQWSADFAKKCGIDTAFATTVLMVDNYLPYFNMDDQKKIGKHIPEQLSAILQDLAAKRQEFPFLQPRTRTPKPAIVMKM